MLGFFRNESVFDLLLRPQNYPLIMTEYGLKSPNASVAQLGLKNVAAAYWNLNVAELVEDTILLGDGVLSDTGALSIDTGEFKGRSPKDRFIVAVPRKGDE